MKVRAADIVVLFRSLLSLSKLPDCTIYGKSIPLLLSGEDYCKISFAELLSSNCYKEQTHDNVVTISDYEHKNDSSDHLRHMLQFCISLFLRAIKLSRNELIMHQQLPGSSLKWEAILLLYSENCYPKSSWIDPGNPQCFRARIFYCVLRLAFARIIRHILFFSVRFVVGWCLG